MKSYLRRSLSYGLNDFLTWIRDTRTICVFLCVIVFLHENLRGIVPFAESYGLKFTPWLFPFITATRIVDMVLWLALLLLLCDLGSEKRIDLYVQMRLPLYAVRCGRLFSAFLRVSAYWFIVCLSPVLLFFNHIEWSLRWGKVIGTLARETTSDVIGDYAIRLSPTIVNRYTPLQATLLCLILSILAGWILGILFLIGNEIFQKLLTGAIVASFFILLDFWIRTDPLACNRLIRFSFVTFHNLRCLSKTPKAGYVTPQWALLFCSISGIACSIFYLSQLRIYEVKNAHHKGFMQIIRSNKSS